MKNFKKILPAIALAGASIIAIAGAGNASAYDYAQLKGYYNGTYVTAKDPQNVEICYTVNDITVPFATTIRVGLSVTADASINMNNVSAVGSSDNYHASSATAGYFEFSFNEDGSRSQATQCNHLNFGGALDAGASFDTHEVIVGTPSVVSGTTIPVDTDNTDNILFGYQLSINQTTKEPTNASGTYQAEYWLKSKPSFESSIVPEYGHITVEKKVKGNAANPNEDFGFKVNISKKYASVDDTNGYSVFIAGKSLKPCDFGSDCTFTLKHGEKAYIGCNNQTCSNAASKQIIIDAFDYVITETDTKGHTPFVDDIVATTNTTGTKTLSTALAEHSFVNEKTNDISGRFFNILPFIILAILATVGVVTLRKANKKNEA